MAAKHISLQTAGGSTVLGALHIGGSEIDSAGAAIGKPLKLHSEAGLLLQSDSYVRIHGSVFASGASTVIASNKVQLEATGFGSSVELGGQVNIGSNMQLAGSSLQSTDPIKALTVTGSTVRLTAADAIHVDAHTVQLTAKKSIQLQATESFEIQTGWNNGVNINTAGGACTESLQECLQLLMVGCVRWIGV